MLYGLIIAQGLPELSGDDWWCLTEAQVPSFNGEKIYLKPAITSFLQVFLRHTFLLPVGIRNTCLTEARRLSPPFILPGVVYWYQDSWICHSSPLSVISTPPLSVYSCVIRSQGMQVYDDCSCIRPHIHWYHLPHKSLRLHDSIDRALPLQLQYYQESSSPNSFNRIYASFTVICSCCAPFELISRSVDLERSGDFGAGKQDEGNGGICSGSKHVSSGDVHMIGVQVYENNTRDLTCHQDESDPGKRVFTGTRG